MGKKKAASSEKKASAESMSLHDGEHVRMDCWHGLLPNEDTGGLLKNDGDFLMRGLEQNGVYHVLLSVRSGKDVLNSAIVEGKQGGFVFKGDHFETIKDIIDFYQVRKRPLVISGVPTTLETPVRRKAWELRHRMVTLGKELGAGSYGTVYKGTLQMERGKPMEVAVKVLTEMSAEASNALWKEARNHQTFDHPNVVKLYGVANDFLPYYLVMELVSGGSVDNYLTKKGKKLDVRARTQILIEAATGLDYLHSKDCLHRDIACRNLLIDSVADFGMSRRSTAYKIDPNKPMNLRWLAPEVYKTAMVHKSTDIYAFGVYEEVVNRGYRLEPPKMMPRMIADLMAECLGPEPERPSFKTVVVCLRSFMKNGNTNRGLGVF
ncbi:Tyrosine-protein kinase [Aphelenchoides fujianensis]|nr:Tyrosine-protein kinase [Aphelenchoides fujianensis]